MITITDKLPLLFFQKESNMYRVQVGLHTQQTIALLTNPSLSSTDLFFILGSPWNASQGQKKSVGNRVMRRRGVDERRGRKYFLLSACRTLTDETSFYTGRTARVEVCSTKSYACFEPCFITICTLKFGFFFFVIGDWEAPTRSC